jgi:hypothetical protein
LLLTRGGVRPSRIRCRFERSSPLQVSPDPFKKPLKIPSGRDGSDTAIESQDSPDVRKKALASDAIEPRSPLFVICGKGSIDHWLKKRKGWQGSSSWRFRRRTRSRAAGDGRAAANEVRPREGGSSRDRVRVNPAGASVSADRSIERHVSAGSRRALYRRCEKGATTFSFMVIPSFG